MVYTCFLCKWRSDKHPQRSYHKFPSDHELKQKWLNILGKSNVSIGTRTSLCSLHFDENCFRYGLVNGRKILKDGSLPTLHLTKGAIESQTAHLVGKIELPSPSTERTLPMPHLLVDDVQMKDTTSKLDVEDNLVEVPMEICSPKESFPKSGPLDVLSKENEILYLKKIVTTLKRSVKRLQQSKRNMKELLTELKKKTHAYEVDNKLMHERNMSTLHETSSKKLHLIIKQQENVIAKQKLKIKSLQGQNRRLQNKIEKIEDLLEPIQEKVAALKNVNLQAQALIKRQFKRKETGGDSEEKYKPML